MLGRFLKAGIMISRLYLAAIMNLYSREIAGMAMSKKNDQSWI